MYQYPHIAMNFLDPATSNRKERVSIYQLDLSSIHKGRRESCYQWLCTAEKSRAQRFVKKQDQDNFVLTYGLLKLVLSHHGHLVPKEIEIHRNKYGKPYIDNPDLYFNLSHAKNLLAIAIAN